jgi:CHAT domain-containing protein/tetratricopeptide (TPR) repeat protein
MKDNNNNNPHLASDETLLRFLETAPHRRGSSMLKESPSGTVGSEVVTNITDLESATPSSCCPKADEYVSVALGSAGANQTELLLEHAANCEVCGKILADCLGTLEGNPSAEEVAAISELAVARMEWQKRMARELAATPVRIKRDSSLWSKWRGVWWAGGAIAATIVVLGLFLWHQRATTPERLLADAYTDFRTLELRIPDASYSALRATSHTRGAVADGEPAPLLDARARLARELERSPDKPLLLQLQARADILEQRYDSAVNSLDRLLATGPVTSDLLVDAASAYYQRGLVSGSETDRSTALDYLRRADELTPDDPVVLFNEAIVMEDRGQVMNAVEVWNRYITVERDNRWAAEGKRKLAALEQALNRLRTHQSRIDKMLSSPQTMDALAQNTHQLNELDEELATLQLHRLTAIAYPMAANDSDRSRGSPCDEKCVAARRLLKAIAASLELQHHDYWLSDLLSPDFNSLPPPTASHYALALDLLGRATDDNQLTFPVEGAKLAQQARSIFLKLNHASPEIHLAAQAGEERSGIEHLYGLQRQVDFVGCRLYASQTLRQPAAIQARTKYAWITAQEEASESICDETPEARDAGHTLIWQALRVCQTSHYSLMNARVQVRLMGIANLAGDHEAFEGSARQALRELYERDSPPSRVLLTYSNFMYTDRDSPRAHTSELCQQEMVRLAEIYPSGALLPMFRMELAAAETRIGAIGEADKQEKLASQEKVQIIDGKEVPADLDQQEIALAQVDLQLGDTQRASRALDQAALQLSNHSDNWATRLYVAARGQLDLAHGHLEQAASLIESEIRSSEGKNVLGGDQKTAAEYAEQDHDLYAELAATWLAQGRTSSSILALWERFRMRSRGLPITQCSGRSLNCDEPRLLDAQRNLGDSVLIGQILLLDRVLVYRMDRDNITWTQRPFRRQDVLDTAQILERAVSSPQTTQSTANLLGNRLSEGLLPSLPSSLKSSANLIIEPDPELANLAWPVLATSGGTLGLIYPLTESRSILASPSNSLRKGGALIHPLVIGASVTSDGEPPLPEALEEARAVTRFLNSPHLLLGGDATRAQVASQLSSASVLHFAGHAVQSQNGTELLLAPSAPESSPWLDGAFLRQYPLRACRLAVLSACATGERKASWNHPLQDIVETLASDGVPEVVATRWQIDSQAAVPLMNAFYQSLSHGNSVAMALTSARRVLSSQSPYHNPYYWGAYYATGTGTQNLRGILNASIEDYP